MYNETQVRKLMSSFAAAFSNIPITADMCTITDFSYNDSAGNPITTFTQVHNAVTGTYSIQLSLFASTSPQVIGALNPFLPPDLFSALLASLSGLGSAVEATVVVAADQFFKDPMTNT